MGKFNKCLKLTIDDLEADESFPPNVDEAAQRFSTLLEVFTRTETEARVKEVLEEVQSAVIGKAIEWSYNQDLQQYCKLARQLAIYFYEASPHHDSRQLSTIKCLLIPRYYSQADRVSPMSFVREYREDRFTPAVSNAIFIRFNESHDFENYLAYPVLFFHEYTAHIYATDNGFNRAFNDGWMLWAASEFLHAQIGGLSPLGLHSSQINRLVSLIAGLQQSSGELADSILLAMNIHKNFPDHFWTFTHRLAAYRHTGDIDFLPKKTIDSMRMVFNRYQNGSLDQAKAHRQFEALIDDIPINP